VRFNADGLAPCIVQDAASGEVLILAYVNRESLRRTVELGETVFWSRSRQELWHKGATSGNTQRVVRIALDCDHDAVLVQVVPAGPACHTGAVGCFRDEASGGLSHPDGVDRAAFMAADAPATGVTGD
jgi:phosphoribosyl-AMP cyclohydrolase